MPIYTEDLDLLKSAVMADVPEGGGAMTGVAVVDGQSNNMFPDSSQVDRTIGRAQIRKLFGVAQTSDTDTLLGTHAIITQPPADPLVHCALFKTPGWADTRTTAQGVIEKYLVKGPRISYRLYGTHYAGSMQIRLVSLVGGPPPSGGDTLVLRNPDGVEQFVRLLRATLSSEPIAVTEGSSTVLLTAYVLTCDIGNKLDFDVLGPPAQRVGLVEADWAQVYSTNIASGAEFCGIKKLGVAGAPGDLSLMTDSGIYIPIVPAATIETPMTDVAPYSRRATASPTGCASISAPVVNMAVGPGTVLTAPGPISPKSLALALGAIQFTEAGDGVLLQGAAPVGAVSYSTGSITFNTSAPSYGVAAVALAYRPATLVAAEPHSAAFTITTANQGTGYVNAFLPRPAPGTFELNYMAQGRWYTLSDAALFGKLSGGSASYGVGALNYDTGSMAVTLGALPDVGSVLLASYGSAASASAYDLATVPSALSAIIETTWGKPVGTLRWTSGGVAKSATPTAGDAQLVRLPSTPTVQRWRFTPATFPDAGVTVDHTVITPHSATVITPHTVITPESTGLLNNNNGTFTLTDVAGTPMAEGSFFAFLWFRNPSNAVVPDSTLFLPIYDKGGRIYAVLGTPAGAQTVDLGSIDYATGQIALSPTFELSMWLRTFTSSTTDWGYSGTFSNVIGQGVLSIGAMDGARYQIGLPSVTTYTSDEVITYTEAVEAVPVTLGGWTLALPSSPSADATNAAVFKLAGTLYTCAAGVLRAGWNVQTGLPAVANAGSLSSDGVLSFTAVPAGGANAITWANLTRDIAVGLSDSGVFRTKTAPLKTGVLQLQAGDLLASANDAGDLSGDYTGTFDAIRGVVRWVGAAVAPETMTYNAVGIGYLPLDASILGLDTVRLPLDGRVPAYRAGGLVIVHNTQSLQLPNPLVKGDDYDMGRVRIADVRIKNALGATVPRTLYTTDLDPGTINVPVASDITAHPQPWTVYHRVEDMVMVNTADISGKLTFSPSLTHDYPAGSSYASGVLLFGDLFARAAGYLDQGTWTGVWSDALIGAAPLANFNDGDFPVTVTNRGAITERWALIFTSASQYRIVGEHVGQIGTGDINTDCAPVNPATGAAYFTVPALGWGGGWAVGNVERFNTYACGAPIHVLRTILQGPYTNQSDQFEIAFRGDVNA